MIASVRGEVTTVALDHAVIEMGGIGLEVRATPATLATLRTGEQARLSTTLIVREDSLTLYGFGDPAARELFVLLQTVSGVGPRLAMAVLAVLQPDALRSALSAGDVTALTQVPGIGRKGAERLIIELRDKVSALAPAASALPGPASSSVARDQVVEALVGLGFTARAAEQAVDGVLAADDAPAETSGVLRRALTTLGRR
jgi:Holliday junction DNA helicase RuvA